VLWPQAGKTKQIINMCSLSQPQAKRKQNNSRLSGKTKQQQQSTQQ